MNSVIRLLAVMLTLVSSFVSAEEVDAILHWQRTVPLSTPVSGVVVEVHAMVGQRVDKGHVLIRLDDRLRLAQVEALEARLKSAENNRNETKRELERTQELYDRTLIANHELEVAKIQRDDGEAQYKEASANLVQAKMDLQYSTVSAPFPALVMQRNVEVGQTIVSELQAEPLVVLVDAKQMVARAQVSGNKISTLRIGLKAGVIVDKQTYQGLITHIELSPEQGTTDQYSVHVSFNVGDNIYRAGQPVKVSF